MQDWSMHTRRRFGFGVGTLLITTAVMFGGTSASAAPLPNHTRLVSTNSAGASGNSASDESAISSNGRYVVFKSSATDLVPGFATNDNYQVYERDLHTGSTVPVSIASPGVGSGGWSPAVSADGRYVAFVLRLPGGGQYGDVYVRDMKAGATKLASEAVGGGAPDGESLEPSISGDGRFVAFTSLADDLVANDTNGVSDVFVVDLATGITVRASVGKDGLEGDGPSVSPAINADGRYVAFATTAASLLRGSRTGMRSSIVRRDMELRRTIVVSRQHPGEVRGSYEPAISADGNTVAYTFQLWGEHLERQGYARLEVDNLLTGAAVVAPIVASRCGDLTSSACSNRVALSADGTTAAVPGCLRQTSPRPHCQYKGDVVWVFRTASGQIEDASAPKASPNRGFRFSSVALDATGNRVVYATSASNLDRPDHNGVSDVFVHQVAVTM